MDTTNLVLVVDDDASMLTSIARLLRQFGYTSLVFPSAAAFTNHGEFGNALCVLLDIQSWRWVRHRLKHFSPGASPISQAVFREVADRAP